jgi:hypothetical protein
LPCMTLTLKTWVFFQTLNCSIPTYVQLTKRRAQCYKIDKAGWKPILWRYFLAKIFLKSRVKKFLDLGT